MPLTDLIGPASLYCLNGKGLPVAVDRPVRDARRNRHAGDHVGLYEANKHLEVHQPYRQDGTLSHQLVDEANAGDLDDVLIQNVLLDQFPGAIRGSPEAQA